MNSTERESILALLAGVRRREILDEDRRRQAREALACPDCARDDGRATALTHAERCDQCLSIVVEMVLYPPTAGGVAARALDGGGR